MKRLIVGVVAVGVVVGAAACSGSDEPDTPDEAPGIGAIDGPAQVDPSYDPFAVDTTGAP